MKKGYHSTQDKTYRTIPRSEFLGIALGYAAGMIAHGILNMEGSVLELAGAACGFVIGYLIDRLWYMEKDVPVEELAEMQQEGLAEIQPEEKP